MMKQNSINEISSILAKTSKITKIDLKENILKDNVIKLLANAIKTNNSLVNLDIS